MADFVEELIARLRKPGLEQRGTAAKRLGIIGDRRAVEPLIAAAVDPENQTIVCEIAQGLGLLKDARAVSVLIELLGRLHLSSTSNCQSLERWISHAIYEIGAEAIEPLRRALPWAIEETEWQAELWRVFAELGGLELYGIGLLRGTLARAINPDFQVLLYRILAAQQALAEVDIAPLVALTAQPHTEWVRENALALLNRIQYPTTEAVITQLLQEADPVLKAAWEKITHPPQYAIFGAMTPAQLSKQLQQLAQQPYLVEPGGYPKYAPIDDVLRALKELGRFAYEAMNTLWEDPQNPARPWAAIVLGYRKDERVRDFLTSALYDQEAYAGWRVKALWALAEVGTDSSHLEALHALLANLTAPYRLREAAGRVVESLRDPRSIPVWIELLVHDRSDIGYFAAVYAAQIGISAIAPLAEVLHNVQLPHRVRFGALLGLNQIASRTADPTAIEALIKVLGDTDKAIRQWAAKQLGELEASAARPALEHLHATDPDEAVREAAAEALYRLAQVSGK